jgi:hypothetical protein
MEDVRAAPFDERSPLPHSEAVLLVDDGYGEVVEVDLFWMRACVPTTIWASPEQ